MPGLILIYITCKDPNEATKISDALLEQKLIACSNTLPQMTSLYNWAGKVQSSSEALLLLKTTENYFDKICEVTTQVHSYDVPCIMSLPINNCNEAYREWLLDQLN